MVLAHLKTKIFHFNKTFQLSFFAAFCTKSSQKSYLHFSPQFLSLYLSYTHSFQVFATPHPTKIALIKVNKDSKAPKSNSQLSSYLTY